MFYVTISAGWICYFIYYYGWETGATSFILPLMLVSMFSLYDTLFNKVAFTVFLFVMRMALFFHCQTHPPVYVLTGIHILIIQILNTVVFFVVASVICISFSSNLQKAEQHLMLYNIELQQQAGTDPLTTLYNRRRMEEVLKTISGQIQTRISVSQSVILIFQKINDTYGHNCGDQVLKSSRIYSEKNSRSRTRVQMGRGRISFLFPEMNLDNAAVLMNEINIAVSKCIISYKDITIHVTMTFGVEENDFQSSISDIVKRADDKLYYGKTHGRDTVIS